MAHLTPMRPPGALVRRDVDEVIDALVGAGITGALTSAVGPFEERVFDKAGFRVHERLLLLRHPLEEIEEPPDAPMRRATRRDRAQVLDVDHRAFQDFWQLDDAGLSDAIRATPHARFRVAGRQQISGYAVTGRSGTAGFLQRLAVHPDHQGRAIGKALVLDGLHWLRRRHASHALVNTQHQNSRAADLYERLGFQREPHDLAVLQWGEAP
ncbi:MAG: GNAT family N-acetyltransferase [Actinomycetota bacterium]|nr:GNAT family N-acetyltransferase [Actinomycetota bacterium]